MAATTKLKLANAFKELVAAKGIKKVTISDITDECNMNRQTFYYHFKDIYDLVEWLFKNAFKTAFPNVVDAESWQNGCVEICNKMLEDEEFIKQAFHSFLREFLDQMVFMNINDVLMEIIENESKDLNLDAKRKELVACYFSNACGGMILQWIYYGMKQSPAELSKTMKELTIPNLKATLKRLAV